MTNPAPPDSTSNASAPAARVYALVISPYHEVVWACDRPEVIERLATCPRPLPFSVRRPDAPELSGAYLPSRSLSRAESARIQDGEAKAVCFDRPVTAEEARAAGALGRDVAALVRLTAMIVQDTQHYVVFNDQPILSAAHHERNPEVLAKRKKAHDASLLQRGWRLSVLGDDRIFESLDEYHRRPGAYVVVLDGRSNRRQAVPDDFMSFEIQTPDGFVVRLSKTEDGDLQIQSPAHALVIEPSSSNTVLVRPRTRPRKDTL